MFSLCTPLGLHYLCGLFLRRVPAGARPKGDTLKLEVYINSSIDDKIIPKSHISILMRTKRNSANPDRGTFVV